MRRNKYGIRLDPAGVAARTVDNIVFDSKHEAAVYQNYIKPNVRAGIFKSLELQKRCPLLAWSMNGAVKVADYVCDFVVTDRDGHPHYIDAKGHRTATYILKRKLFFANYGLTIEEL